MAHDSITVCCQRESEGLCQREYQFQTIHSFVIAHDDGRDAEEPISDTEKTSPLAFLASVGLAFKDNDSEAIAAKWNIAICEGKERITVVPGPSGVSVRLHKGNGRLPPMDLTKPFAKKCRNRECNNLGGQLGKPRSIYCSKRCQSREQNLRQGRIKNVRSPTPTNLPKRSTSPRSSPSPVSMMGASSPVPMSGSPTVNMIRPIGMTPSPIALSPVPSPYTSFSPIPMSSSIPNPASSPIVLPRPTQPSPTHQMVATQYVKPTPTTARPPSLNHGSIASSFSPAPQQKKQFGDSMDDYNVTLAPILSKS